MSCLIIAEHDNTTLRASTRHAISAAVQLGGEVQVLVAGSGCALVAGAAAGIAGVTKVLLADAPHYADQTAENLAPLIVAQAARYSHLFAPATTFGKNLMPRVAALLDVAQISEVVEIVSPSTFVRATYAGNVMASVESIDPVKVITVRTTAFAAAGDAPPAAVEAIAATADLGLSRVVSRDLSQSARPELSAAKVVVCGGRGLGSGEVYRQLLEPLADRLGAALGASRAAVDAGYVANDLQVGQTGKIVAPQLYIAVGISGAIQHLAGMKDSQVIVAINKDPEAPIFQVADYGLVADLAEAVPALIAALD